MDPTATPPIPPLQSLRGSDAGGGSLALDPASVLGERAARVLAQFSLPLPLSNPVLFEMFVQRDVQPYQSLLPWSGEFVGKWLVHLIQLLKLLPAGSAQAAETRAAITQSFTTLSSPGYQLTDGYCGPWPSTAQLNPNPPDGVPQPWDTWGHYYLLLAAALWVEWAGDTATALPFATKIADLMVARLGGDPKKLYALGALEQNCAILHGMALMYRLTRTPAYLQLCSTIIEEWALPPGGDYLNNALAGKPFYQGSQPRWEGLCSITGLAELYALTGTAEYATAYQQIWWNLCELELHNTGGFMSGEGAAGSPYNSASEETCCAVTYSAMSVEMLRMTGNSVAADILERMLFNSGLYLLSPSGTWCTYNTPMAGQRESTTIEIAFQARPGASLLSCCSVNGPRMVGLAAEYAVMTTATGVAINLYTPLTATVPVHGHGDGDGNVDARGSTTSDTPTMQLSIETSYPLAPTIALKITSSSASAPSDLWLRIPAWSERNTLSINGAAASPPAAGAYHKLTRQWQAGDVLVLNLDFRLRGWIMDTTDSGGATSGGGAEEQDTPLGDDFVLVTSPPDEPPQPVWDAVADGGWSAAAGRRFDGTAAAVLTVDASQPALGNAPSTMMGWFACGRASADAPGIAFSCGAHSPATPNRARALDLFAANANYFQGGGQYDLTNVVAAASAAAWTAALASQKWHHVAVADDGSTASFYLDGKLVGQHAVSDASRSTQGGYMVGGWADNNRFFAGYLGGVRFYSQALAAADIATAMTASAPSVLPDFPALVSIYRGPLLLAYDPRFNAGAPDANIKPLAAADLKAGARAASTDSWLKPLSLWQIGSGAGAVQLCDLASAGLTGLKTQTWLPVDFAGIPGGRPQPVPWSQAKPSRTFFFADLGVGEASLDTVATPRLVLKMARVGGGGSAGERGQTADIHRLQVDASLSWRGLLATICRSFSVAQPPARVCWKAGAVLENEADWQAAVAQLLRSPPCDSGQSQPPVMRLSVHF